MNQEEKHELRVGDVFELDGVRREFRGIVKPPNAEAMVLWRHYGTESETTQAMRPPEWKAWLSRAKQIRPA